MSALNYWSTPTPNSRDEKVLYACLGDPPKTELPPITITADKPFTDKGTIFTLAISASWSRYIGLNGEIGMNLNLKNGYFQYFMKYGSTTGYSQGVGVEANVTPNYSLKESMGSGPVLDPSDGANTNELELGYGPYGGNFTFDQGTYTPRGLGYSAQAGWGASYNTTHRTWSTTIMHVKKFLKNLIPPLPISSFMFR